MRFISITLISFISFFCSTSCSSNTDNSFSNENKCIDDCCFEDFSCNEFFYDGKNPLPYSVKCDTPHYSSTNPSEPTIDGKTCHKMDSTNKTFCCQKP